MATRMENLSPVNQTRHSPSLWAGAEKWENARMSDPAAAEQPKSALVFGARNLGRAVVEALLREGWQVAAAARSDATLETVRELGRCRCEPT